MLKTIKEFENTQYAQQFAKAAGQRAERGAALVASRPAHQVKPTAPQSPSV